MTKGVCRGLFSTDESTRKRWLKLTVVDTESEVEMLVGSRDLEGMELALVQLTPTTPVVAQRDMVMDPNKPHEIGQEVGMKRTEVRWQRGLSLDTFTLINPREDEEFRRADRLYTAPNRAQLLYVPQAPRSQADRAFMETFIKDRLKYGIDEPGQAHANLPVYSLPKPNTEVRRVILDDSLGSTINMYSLGMRLPRLLEVRAFTADAQIITSIDLASYFTQIRIDPSCRDFWTFDGGSHGRVRAT
ncbi:hypothetical protein H4R33_007159 [Dimargaris cristalligena]|nr:hypothetical protein H4R33_007159 [Dimargaris cristalligena]